MFYGFDENYPFSWKPFVLVKILSLLDAIIKLF